MKTGKQLLVTVFHTNVQKQAQGLGLNSSLTATICKGCQETGMPGASCDLPEQVWPAYSLISLIGWLELAAREEHRFKKVYCTSATRSTNEYRRSLRIKNLLYVIYYSICSV